MSFLKVSKTKIVNEAGEEVVLRGAGLGGWMTMENFITGFPACEFQAREALAEVLGTDKAEFFFNQFLEHFFADADAAFFKSLGLNCIRIAVNYRHFEDDLNPRVLKPNAFKHLDRAIATCAAHSIYTIIDMHTAPGGQSGGWHADAGTHLGKFWVHKDFQDRFVWLWTQIALRYKDNPWVAGYNVLNEPADPHPACKGLIGVYDRVIRAIREEAGDVRHVVFLDGNTFATDFTKFPERCLERWGENTAFAIHDYAVYGFPAAPGVYERSEEQMKRMKGAYERKRRWMDERGLCVWNGEWGPVYARREYDGEETERINERRYWVLEDQLEIYRKDRLSWSIWLYKDIGFQGMVYVSKSTPYMELFKDFLARKHRLSVDAWGKDDAQVKHIYQPIIDLIRSAVADDAHLKLYPPLWSVEERVTRVSRTILVAEFLVREWAEMFRGFDEERLEELARSLRFENCEKREGLNKALRENAGLV
ncbi:putative glucan 1,3-beta-glucosidase A [Hypsizygus marmoreus]|uniref:Glucan 1,3-beta-glucosidase A n=1 Tax=Hypsizygus marmoreus TaxID=39966 RepID=A0A369JI72_HYPMA|nr:putative glucan 1,3-beta-glucosidase A [Hypsizygus marmoreus]